MLIRYRIAVAALVVWSLLMLGVLDHEAGWLL